MLVVFSALTLFMPVACFSFNILLCVLFSLNAYDRTLKNTPIYIMVLIAISVLTLNAPVNA